MNASAEILLVDDEPTLQRAMAPLLRSQGFGVRIAGTGRAAIDVFEQQHPDLVILDLGLPDMPGNEVCRIMRARANTPILVLSARGEEKDNVAALDAGADDYVTKPFGPDELLARIRAALRRGLEGGRRGQIVRGDFVVDFDRRRVYRHDTEIYLTPKEFDLFALLARQAGRVLTHRTISRTLWGPQFTDQAEHVRVLVGQLRKKIEPDPARPRFLLTEPWVGYRFADAE